MSVLTSWGLNVGRALSRYEREAVDQGLRSLKEFAERVGCKVSNLVWYRRHSHERGLPPFPKGVELGSRTFYTDNEIEAWIASRPSNRAKEIRKPWPPSARAFITHHAVQPLRPTARQFPDDRKTAIPEATNPITGRIIRPQWRSCLGCGVRFISLGGNERLACTVPEAARGKPTLNTCITKNTTGMSDMFD